MAEPQVIQQTQTTIPEYARRYVEDLLGVGAGTIFNYQKDAQGNVVRDAQGLPIIAGFNPYMQYTGERFAQFTPLQQQAFKAAAEYQLPGQMGQASELAKAAAERAGQTTYTPTDYQAKSWTAQGTPEQYMSPYMQSVVDIQKREAQRAADVASTRRGADFAKAGAFGGARQAIENAEAQRNLAMQMGDIQARGSQEAYQQGMGQFNAEQAARQAAAQLGEQSRQYGAGLGLQGLQASLTGAGTLGQLGQNIYGQQTGLMGLQSQLGGQQQQQMQNLMTADYQDFLNAQNMPYKQLGFMSDLLRGTQGLGQQTMYQYQQPPSAMNQLIGLGTSALGLSRLGGLKKGGAVRAGLADLAISRMA